MTSEVRAAKHLGQHFLQDDTVISRMVAEIAPKTGDHILEIGPGLGALTLPVLRICQKMTAIEFDHRVIAPLTRKAATVGQLHLLEADVLKVHFASEVAPPIRVIGNLPYNLSSPILFHCLAQRAQIVDMHFMLQKEVVDRMTAQAGSKVYGRLSLMCQLYCEAEALFDIGAEAFDPPPKVDSSVVRLIPRQTLAWPVESIPHFEKIVRLAFSQRRKMLRKSLATWFDAEALVALDIDPTARPETITGEDFARLANALANQEKEHE